MSSYKSAVQCSLPLEYCIIAHDSPVTGELGFFISVLSLHIYARTHHFGTRIFKVSFMFYISFR